MIAFDLQCSCGYRFEGWFDSRGDFDRQVEEGLILCPDCAGADIMKILSPVAVRTSKGRATAAADQPQVSEQQMLELFRSVQTYVEQNFEDVGAGFAQESLKIHYGVEKPRNIRGVTTPEEEKMLEKEGVELMKIPMIKDESDPEYN